MLELVALVTFAVAAIVFLYAMADRKVRQDEKSNERNGLYRRM